MQINFVPIPEDCEKYVRVGELYHVMKNGIIQTLVAIGLPNGEIALGIPGDTYEQEGFWNFSEFDMIEDLWG